MNLYLYTKNKHGNIILLNGDRSSFRCRQRGKLSNGERVPSLPFISYRQCQKYISIYGKQLYGPFQYNTISKL